MRRLSKNKKMAKLAERYKRPIMGGELKAGDKLYVVNKIHELETYKEAAVLWVNPNVAVIEYDGHTELIARFSIDMGVNVNTNFLGPSRFVFSSVEIYVDTVRKTKIKRAIAKSLYSIKDTENAMDKLWLTSLEDLEQLAKILKVDEKKWKL